MIVRDGLGVPEVSWLLRGGRDRPSGWSKLPPRILRRHRRVRTRMRLIRRLPPDYAGDRNELTLADVQAAQELIDGVVRHTPVIGLRPLTELVGGPVRLKCENLQRAGSFKIRGAYTRLSRLSEEEKRRGWSPPAPATMRRELHWRRRCWTSGRPSSCQRAPRSPRSPRLVGTAPR